MHDERKRGILLPIAVTAVVLLGLYVGAYYAIVKSLPISLQSPSLPFRPLRAQPRYPVGSDGPWVQQTLHWLFAPIHRIDRFLRPGVWEEQ